jgi:hypothetical protein
MDTENIKDAWRKFDGMVRTGYNILSRPITNSSDCFASSFLLATPRNFDFCLNRGGNLMSSVFSGWVWHPFGFAQGKLCILVYYRSNRGGEANCDGIKSKTA